MYSPFQQTVVKATEEVKLDDIAQAIDESKEILKKEKEERAQKGENKILKNTDNTVR